MAKDKETDDLENPSQDMINQAAGDVIAEIILEFNMKLFEAIRESYPGLVGGLKEDFDEWNAVTMEVLSKGDGSMKQVFRRLPKNKWGILVRRATKSIRSRIPSQITEETKEAFGMSVAKRILKQDIN